MCHFLPSEAYHLVKNTKTSTKPLNNKHSITGYFQRQGGTQELKQGTRLVGPKTSWDKKGDIQLISQS